MNGIYFVASFPSGCFKTSPLCFPKRQYAPIGNNVFIAPKANLVMLNHTLAPMPYSAAVAKPIVVEDGVYISKSSTVPQGITTGKNSVVGTNSVLTRAVPPGRS